MGFKYFTISESGESLHKAKGSKHFGFAFHVKDESEIGEHLEALRKLHHGSRHVCYAWRLGHDKSLYRANDDGEPNNSAGMPILGQIEKYDLTNVLVAVVRYFGGTKLGVGGLIDAYRTAASEAIENAVITERQLMSHFELAFEYPLMSDVMLTIRTHHWSDYDQDFQESCKLKISILPENEAEFRQAFEPFSDLRIEFLGTY
jgi:uncharacterized YigZ family protein